MLALRWSPQAIDEKQTFHNYLTLSEPGGLRQRADTKLAHVAERHRRTGRGFGFNRSPDPPA
jgi:hypothetical protein